MNKVFERLDKDQIVNLFKHSRGRPEKQKGLVRALNPRQLDSLLIKIKTEQENIQNITPMATPKEFCEKLFSYMSPEQANALYDLKNGQIIDLSNRVIDRDSYIEQLEDENYNLENLLRVDADTGLNTRRAFEKMKENRIDCFLEFAESYLKAKVGEKRTNGRARFTDITPIHKIIGDVMHDIESLQSRNKTIDISNENYLASNLITGYSDLNGFKVVNDRFGHVAGDKILRAMGDAYIRVKEESESTFGKSVESYRIGGDEVVFTVEDPEEGQVDQIMHKLNDIMMDPQTYAGMDTEIGEDYKVPISIGTSDRFSLSGMFRMLSDYSENREDTLTLEQLQEDQEVLRDGLCTKADSYVLGDAEKRARDDKEAFYNSIREKEDSDLTGLERSIKSGRYGFD